MEWSGEAVFSFASSSAGHGWWINYAEASSQPFRVLGLMLLLILYPSGRIDWIGYWQMAVTDAEIFFRIAEISLSILSEWRGLGS